MKNTNDVIGYVNYGARDMPQGIEDFTIDFGTYWDEAKTKYYTDSDRKMYVYNRVLKDFNFYVRQAEQYKNMMQSILIRMIIVGMLIISVALIVIL